MTSFFQELKQRRIVQVVASYAVSGWVATEVIGALVERGLLPELAYRIAFVLFLGGLVASLVMGWFHGEKGHQQAPRLEIALLAVVALATGYFGVQTFRSAQAAARVQAALTEGSLDLRRVAVLYFRDQSRSGDLGYLADGLTESLIDQLGEINGLTVISRDGSAQVRDADLTLDSIGALLSAGILVDGTLERSGDKVRVNLALVDGDGGGELLRESVERPADDVLALQDELAEAVADFLRGALGSEISLREARRGTNNAAAWATFLRGQRARRDGETALRSGDVGSFVTGLQRADSLFAAAAALDEKWAQPVAYRGLISLRFGRESAYEDPTEGREYLDQGLGYVDQALVLDPRYATAHQFRGLIQFDRWSLGLTVDATEASQSFDEARESLEQATSVDPNLASAWNTLSVLYSQIPDNVAANLAARRALEADEFLLSAESVLARLYATSYDLEQFREAIQFCDQGHERFPKNPTFTDCSLWLMAAPRGLQPDPARAWELVETHLALLSEPERVRARIQDQLLVAGILARADLPDSALAVIGRSQAGTDIDPDRELLGIEALDYLALDDPDTAVERLKVYLTASPEHRTGWRWTSHWWWRDLQSNPEFRRLIGG